MRIANLLPAGYGEGFDPSPELISSGTVVEPVMMELPALPTNALELVLTDVAAAEAAIRAQNAGYDALFVNSVADYGLRAIRSAVRIPAIGAGQAAMLLACQLGHRFSIVSILPPSLGEAHAVQLREYQLTNRCASMRFVTTEHEMLTIAEPDSFYARMRARRQDMIERIGQQVTAAIDDDAADVIVLGCTCMAPVASDLAELTGACVINPLDAAYLQTEMIVRLGLAHSETAYRPAPAGRGAALAAMTSAAVPHLGLAPACDDACAVLAEDGRRQPAAVSG
jgi:Asp/Glu/hydantoin racemase